MNYSSLVFRKDMTGVDEYVKWTSITSDLMKAYLYSQRSVINGISYITFQDQLISEDDVLKAFGRFFGIYQKVLERGYEIDKIADNNGLFSFLLPYDNKES